MWVRTKKLPEVAKEVTRIVGADIFLVWVRTRKRSEYFVGFCVWVISNAIKDGRLVGRLVQTREQPQTEFRGAGVTGADGNVPVEC